MYQQITVVGNVGRDPELRYTPQGFAVCDFSVAVNRRTGTGPEATDETTWFRITCWRQLAETVAKYVKKGRQVLVVGEIAVSAYTDKQGEAAATLELTARTVKFLGARTDGGNVQQPDGGEDSDEKPAPRGNNRGGRRGSNVTPDENSDDIPF